MISAAILTFAAEAFFGALIDDVAGDVYEKLKGDPARNAFKRALGAAIQRYATGPRLPLANPLLDEQGVLTLPAVATELTHIIRFDREPDAKLIGDQWKQALESPPQWRDFTEEARRLLGYLQSELRDTDVFRPVFEARDLNQVAVNTEAATEHLAHIEAQLGDLVELMQSRFGGINAYFLNATFGIRDQIRDYTNYIEEKTRGFVGRQFIFDAVDQFLNEKSRGYILVRGDPGIGKTALAAQIVKTRGYVHHFNIRAEGVNKASDFLKNVCAQLIAVYELEHTVLPPEATQDGGFLRKLLEEVSAKLDGEKCMIVVDALDEVDNLGVSSGTNTLYLPMTLPEGIYVICTMRRDEVPLRIDIPEQLPLFIEQDDAGNIADVREYVTIQTPRAGIQTYIQIQNIDDSFFIQHMVEKSQGNFIYLRMVLPEIEQGAYTDLDLTAIPAGLFSYYQDCWSRLRRDSELDWFDFKLPVIIALTVVKEPVSIDLLSDFSYIDDKRRIRAVLNDFDQFIYKVDVDYDGGKQRRYRWYHASFFEFIADKEEVSEEHVDLVEGHRKIADKMWSELFDE
jgi:hypothetical protein